MSVDPSDVRLYQSYWNPKDTIQRVGGIFVDREVGSDVDEVFVPGLIFPSDFTDNTYYQHRKVFIYNDHPSEPMINVQVWGYNLLANDIIKFAVERGSDSEPLLDGSEVTKNYKTAPSLFGFYEWTECHSDDALDVGNDGIIPPGSGQGIWLRMGVDFSDGQEPSDTFRIGLRWD